MNCFPAYSLQVQIPQLTAWHWQKVKKKKQSIQHPEDGMEASDRKCLRAWGLWANDTAPQFKPS